MPDAFWVAIPAIVAAVGVIINNILAFLARNEMAKNTKVTEETKKATETTGQQVADAAIGVKDAAELSERAGAVAELASKGLASDIKNLQYQLNGVSATRKQVDENTGRIANLEADVKGMKSDIGQILAIVKEKP